MKRARGEPHSRAAGTVGQVRRQCLTGGAGYEHRPSSSEVFTYIITAYWRTVREKADDARSRHLPPYIAISRWWPPGLDRGGTP